MFFEPTGNIASTEIGRQQMSSNNCKKRAIIALAVGLLSSCGNGKQEAVQKPYKNAMEFLLDADNNLLQSFQIVPLVAILYQENRLVMSIRINRKGEIFFDPGFCVK